MNIKIHRHSNLENFFPVPKDIFLAIDNIGKETGPYMRISNHLYDPGDILCVHLATGETSCFASLGRKYVPWYGTISSEEDK